MAWIRRRAQQFITLLFFCTLFACALPVEPGKELGNFVPQKELLTVSLLREGMAFFNQSRFVDAELKFRQALYLDPSLINVKTNLAVSLERLGLHEESEAMYHEILKEKPDEIPIHMGLGRLYYARNRRQEAKQAYERALNLAYDKNDTAMAAQIARSISVMAFKWGEEEPARCYSEQAFKLSSDVTEFHKHLRLLIAIGNFDEALETLENFAAARALQRDSLILYEKGLISFAKGKPADALSYTRLALQGAAFETSLQQEAIMLRNLSLLQLPQEMERAEFDEEAREAFLEVIEEKKKSLSLASLYWPAPLLEAVYRLGPE